MDAIKNDTRIFPSNIQILLPEIILFILSKYIKGITKTILGQHEQEISS
jgi:hypothetical protein